MLGTSWHHEIPLLPCWFTIRGVHENSWSNGLVQGKILTITGWWFGCHFGHFPIYRVSNHPNWRTHIFHRGSNHQPDEIWGFPVHVRLNQSIKNDPWDGKWIAFNSSGESAGRNFSAYLSCFTEFHPAGLQKHQKFRIHHRLLGPQTWRTVPFV